MQHCASLLQGKNAVAIASLLAVWSVDLVHSVRLVQTHVGTRTCCVAALQGWTCNDNQYIANNTTHLKIKAS
jgi:hypothetical protein